MGKSLFKNKMYFHYRSAKFFNSPRIVYRICLYHIYIYCSNCSLNKDNTHVEVFFGGIFFKDNKNETYIIIALLLN